VRWHQKKLELQGGLPTETKAGLARAKSGAKNYWGISYKVTLSIGGYTMHRGSVMIHEDGSAVTKQKTIWAVLYEQEMGMEISFGQKMPTTHPSAAAYMP